MKLARVLCFLIIFGSSAIAAHAQTPLVPSGGAGDPRIIFPDACPADAYLRKLNDNHHGHNHCCVSWWRPRTRPWSLSRFIS